MAGTRKPDLGLFVGIVGVIGCIFIPILQANGVDMNWQWSIAAYVVLISVCVWSLLAHAIPHKGKSSRWLATSFLVIALGGIGSFAVMKQLERERQIERKRAPDRRRYD